MYFAKDGIKKSAHCFETITHLQQLPLENPRIRHCTIFLYIPVYRTFLWLYNSTPVCYYPPILLSYSPVDSPSCQLSSFRCCCSVAVLWTFMFRWHLICWCVCILFLTIENIWHVVSTVILTVFSYVVFMNSLRSDSQISLYHCTDYRMLAYKTVSFISSIFSSVAYGSTLVGGQQCSRCSGRLQWSDSFGWKALKLLL